MDNKTLYTAPHAKAIKIETNCILAASTTGDIEDGKLNDFDELLNSSNNDTYNEDNE